MTVHMHIRGVSGRQGVFLSGKPQQLLVFDDGIVMVQAAGAMALAPGGGATAGALLQQRTARQGDQGAETGADFAAATKRATYARYDMITRAELGRGRLQNKLRIETQDGRRYSHSYQPTFGPDEHLVPLLQQHLGGRFVNNLFG